jgi:hypothetical protein
MNDSAPTEFPPRESAAQPAAPMPATVPPTPLVAVVAVHGVADQAPSSTARLVADLLARIRRDDSGVYQAFQETAIRIPVDAVEGPHRTKAEPSLTAYRQATPATEVVATPQSQVQDTVPETVAAKQSKDAAHKYMKEQLTQYTPEGPDAVFDTIRLESVCTAGRCRVHVYEAYWADLSRLKSSVLSVFLELYQLMFYVCSLGRKTIALARLEQPPPSPSWWSALGWVHAGVEWPLVLGVPIVNLLLLAVSAVLFVLALPEKYVPSANIGALAALAAIVVTFILYLRLIRAKGGRWPLLGVLLPAFGAVAGVLVYATGANAAPYRTLGFVVFLALEVAVLFLMAAYQQRRLGALPIALIAVALLTLDFGHALWGTLASNGSDKARLMDAVLRTAEDVFLVLEWCWTVIIVAIVLTVAVALIATRQKREPVPSQQGQLAGAQRSSSGRLRRAAWTAILSAVLPSVVVLVLNISVWNAIVAAGRTIVCETQTTKSRHESKAKEPCQGIQYTPRWQWTNSAVQPPCNTQPIDTGDLVEELLGRSSRSLAVAFPFLVVAGAIAFWCILPAVVSELPPALKRTKWPSAWLGEALSAGFKAMRWSGAILCTLFLVLVMSLLSTWLGAPLGQWFSGWPKLPWLLGSAVMLAITASRGPFRFLALGFRSALDIALDVTNWLRMHPLHRNPRARICARYVSLLRHICRWTHPIDGSPYRALVIVAHSQGTVITTELLTFLGRVSVPDPELDRLDPSARNPLPVYLLTVGCPLQQLYSLRFPHLYGWARHTAGQWPGPAPDPKDLRVKCWYNAYRSGDYVGRYLWHADAGSERWDDSVGYAGATRKELCLGAGAHTHYFDETAMSVATILDYMICQACA